VPKEMGIYEEFEVENKMTVESIAERFARIERKSLIRGLLIIIIEIL
jgi:hypothetical protein